MAQENALVPAVKNWATAVLQFYEEISTSQKQLTIKELNVMKKIVMSSILLVAHPEEKAQPDLTKGDKEIKQ